MLDDESTGLAMYRTGQIDCGPNHFWSVRQADLESLQKSHPHLMYRDYQSNVSSGITMRTDQPPFNDVRVRRAISHALDRQGIIEAVYIRGEATPALARGLVEWSLPVDQLGAGARYYQYDPKEARRLLVEAGYPKGFKTQLTATSGLGRDLVDAVQLVQRFLKDVGIEVELKLQEYGAYMATTAQGKYEGMVYGPVNLALDPDAPLYGRFIPDHPMNRGYVNDPTITAMLKEQRRTKDLEARRADHFCDSAVCGRAAALCVRELRHDHCLLAAICEELCPQPHFRLRQSCGRPVAGSLGARGSARAAAPRGRRTPPSMTRTTWCLVGLGMPLCCSLPGVSGTMPPCGADAGSRCHCNQRCPRKRVMVIGPCGVAMPSAPGCKRSLAQYLPGR